MYYEEKLREYLNKIYRVDEAAETECRIKWDSIAKPVDGLGQFEKTVARIAAMTGSAKVDVGRKAVIIMCADNGVVEEGVTQTDSSVTAIVAENFAGGKASVNAMADVAGAEVFPVDIGVNVELTAPGILQYKVAKGTGNISRGPAMSREQACQAIVAGIEIVGKLKAEGFRIFATGEMGIGNTTTTSALTSVITGDDVSEVTGKGAGLSDKALSNKIDVVKRAIDVNTPDRSDALDMLSKLGGFDIAGMTGVFLGGAVHRCPVITDGAISCVSAVLAMMLEPVSVQFMIASHMGREPSCAALLDILGLRPVIYADMALGEGTGAVMFMSMLNTVMNVYNREVTFGDINVDAYCRFDGEKNGDNVEHTENTESTEC